MVTDSNAALAAEAAKAALAVLSKGSTPVDAAVPMVTRTDYASFYKDPSLADTDPVLLRKGTRVVAVFGNLGNPVAVTIPPGTPVFSGMGGSPYKDHPSFNSHTAYYTKPGNLTKPPEEAMPATSPSTMPGGTFGWSTPTLALVGVGLGAIGFGLYMARKRRAAR